MPRASAGSTPHGRRERCKARSRIASCGSSCSRAICELPDALLAQHPGLVTVRVPAAVAAKFPGGATSVYLLDPLGNLVLRYPDDPDIKGIARDLTRLLKASRIG